MKRTKEQWQALIEAQLNSGLPAAQFCQQHGLDDKYFSLRKKQLRQPVPESTFVPATRASNMPPTGASALTLTYGRCSLQFNDAPAATWLASLVQALS
ncbi:MAG TPA: IS66 family insertion sequence element accessory protein TnpB [Cellvibrio sp.]|nr:IS66 family insertion sequence element accessory protein TnpB [Cellvibrio sp.]